MRRNILFFFALIALAIFGCGGGGTTTNPPTPLAVQTNSLPAGAFGTTYTATLSATGGKAPYTWSQTSGTLPPGLTLNPGTGAITGTPTEQAASSNLSFQVKDSNNATASSTSLSIMVKQAVLAITPTSIETFTVGSVTNQSLTASPATTGPYTWTVESGALPQGVVFNNGTNSSSTSVSTTSSSVTLIGTPTTTGTYSFSLVVTDSETPTAGTSPATNYTGTVSGSTAACVVPTPVNPTVSTVSCSSSTPGCLDASFGGGSGYSLTNTDGPVPFTQDIDGGRSIGVQSDGKIVALGGTTDPTLRVEGYAVTRYNSDGSLDTAFGNGGIASYFFPTTIVTYEQDGVLQPDGNILLIGTGGGADLAAVRFTSTGALDTTFGSGGALTLNFGAAPGGAAFGTALQTDGKILIAGVNYASDDWIVARLNSNGTLDNTFGSNGIAVLALGANCTNCGARAVAVQNVNSQEFILVGGAVENGFGLVRLAPSGALDTTFGNGNGQVSTTFCGLRDRIQTIRLDNSGNILTAGQAGVGTDAPSSQFGLARFTAAGVLDTTFGDISTTSSQRTGKTVLDFFGGSGLVSPAGLAIQSDNRFLVSGYTSSADAMKDYFGIARYNSDGTLDPIYGTNGAVALDFGGGSNFGYRITLQSDGKSVVVGTAGFASGPHAGYNFAVARLWP